MKKRRAPVWAAVLVVFFAAATFLFLRYTRSENVRLWFDAHLKNEPSPDPALLVLGVEQATRDALADLGVAEEQLSIEGVEADGAGSGPKVWEAALPLGVSLEKANLVVTMAVEGAAGKVIDGVEWKAKRRGLRGRRCLTLNLGADSIPCLELRLYESPRQKKGDAPPPARLAIVVGGLGHKLDEPTRSLIECPWPLTLAVLPGCEASAETAQIGLARGKEVLLHLPMEPRGYPRVDPGEGAILLEHSPKEIKRRLRSHIQELGCAAGVVNYMGSAGTRDRDVMRSVLEGTKKAGLFFIDSAASPHSVAKETAAELEVPCLVNDLFLEEGAQGSDLLKKRVMRAERIARQEGRALVIAKPTGSLLKLLTERAGAYSSEGIILVKASELLEDD